MSTSAFACAALYTASCQSKVCTCFRKGKQGEKGKRSTQVQTQAIEAWSHTHVTLLCRKCRLVAVVSDTTARIQQHSFLFAPVEPAAAAEPAPVEPAAAAVVPPAAAAARGRRFRGQVLGGNCT